MSDYLESRREALRRAQNSDGGWGYFPGKQSWLEPTAYALLALHGDPASTTHWERGWTLLRSWQTPEGGWKPTGNIPSPGWGTALAVTLHCVRGVYDSNFNKGVSWLLGTVGAEGGLLMRISHLLRPSSIDSDFGLQGWPWLPDNASWVEPTSHAMIALRKANSHASQSQIAARLNTAEKMMINRRCVDGGWNYGNRRVLSTDLPSYPETTGIGLIGMLGARQADLKPSIAKAKEYWTQCAPGMARSWLAIALRNLGEISGPSPAGLSPSEDHLSVALEAIAAEDGNYRLLKS